MAKRALARGPSVEDDDSSDDEPVAKKKKQNKQLVAPPEKIGSMRPAAWTQQRLTATPIRKNVWEGELPEPAVDEEAVELHRERLGLRVPAVGRLPCKFWLQGRCHRGQACSFAHVSAGEAAASNAATCPPPIESLSDRGLPRTLGRSMLHLGYREPSPIQAQAWPAALKGHDLLCRAPTGSGKTLAYLLPACAHALAAGTPRGGTGPAALVLVPTRELCMQVLGLCRKLQRPSGVRAEALYGGEPREEQAEAMEGAFHVLVATAGRCTDMLSSGHVSLARVGCLVLDEADQLLTLGFSVQVSQVLSQIRPDRQMLLFSATLSERLETVVGKWFTKPPLRIYADEAVNMNVNASTAPAEPESLLPEVAADEASGEASGEASYEASGGASLDTEAAAMLSNVPSSVEQRFVLCGQV